MALRRQSVGAIEIHVLLAAVTLALGLNADSSYMVWQLQNARLPLTSQFGEAAACSGDMVLVLGGCCSTDAVWASSDGSVTWSEIPHNGTRWVARYFHAASVSAAGTVFVLGGQSNTGILNDVWRSTDLGVSWSRQTEVAQWSKRSNHVAMVLHDNSIVVLAGLGAVSLLNDVWRSIDGGVTWTQQTAAAEWSSRARTAAVVLGNDAMFVLGGFSASASLNDVWSSSDKGVSWIQVQAAANWSKRQDHAAVVVNADTILVLGGFSAACSGGKCNDVWFSSDFGSTWYVLYPTAAWNARGAFMSGVLSNGSVVVLGGLTDSSSKDAWLSNAYPFVTTTTSTTETSTTNTSTTTSTTATTSNATAGNATTSRSSPATTSNTSTTANISAAISPTLITPASNSSSTANASKFALAYTTTTNTSVTYTTANITSTTSTNVTTTTATTAMTTESSLRLNKMPGKLTVVVNEESADDTVSVIGGILGAIGCVGFIAICVLFGWWLFQRHTQPDQKIAPFSNLFGDSDASQETRRVCPSETLDLDNRPHQQTSTSHGSSSPSGETASSSNLHPEMQRAPIVTQPLILSDDLERSSLEPNHLNPQTQVQVNDEGALVQLGTNEYAHVYYCGRILGIAAIPGSDGQCGPNDGPACASCQRFLKLHRLYMESLRAFVVERPQAAGEVFQQSSPSEKPNPLNPSAPPSTRLCSETSSHLTTESRRARVVAQPPLLGDEAERSQNVGMLPLITVQAKEDESLGDEERIFMNTKMALAKRLEDENVQKEALDELREQQESQDPVDVAQPLQCGDVQQVYQQPCSEHVEMQLPIQAQTQSSSNLSQVWKASEVTLTLMPGSLGVKANWNSGRISFVDPNSQGQRKGILAGWTIGNVNGQPYSEQLLDSVISGTDEYRVTFIVEAGDPLSRDPPLPPPPSAPPPLDRVI